LLEARYLALQRRTHPDGFTRATPAEKLRALEAAAAVNEAYAILKDPFRRAALLVAGVVAGAGAAVRDQADPSSSTR
jgi:molecular chaperone HscB